MKIDGNPTITITELDLRDFNLKVDANNVLELAIDELGIETILETIFMNMPKQLFTQSIAEVIYEYNQQNKIGLSSLGDIVKHTAEITLSRLNTENFECTP